VGSRADCGGSDPGVPSKVSILEELIQQLLWTTTDEFTDCPPKGVVGERFAAISSAIRSTATLTLPTKTLSDPLFDDTFENGAFEVYLRLVGVKLPNVGVVEVITRVVETDALRRGRPRGEPASTPPPPTGPGVGRPFYVSVTASVTLTVTNLSRLVRELGA